MNKFQIFIKLDEFTFTTSGEVLNNPLEKDDDDPLHCPEKDRDLLLRLKLENNLEETCKGCP